MDLIGAVEKTRTSTGVTPQRPQQMPKELRPFSTNQLKANAFLRRTASTKRHSQSKRISSKTVKIASFRHKCMQNVCELRVFCGEAKGIKAEPLFEKRIFISIG